MPNAFSPDGNGVNDIFVPGILGVHDYTFLVFDRWGTQLFETHDVEEGWDGKFDGNICPQAI
jgi:gliding motility-associated-like protein